MRTHCFSSFEALFVEQWFVFYARVSESEQGGREILEN